MTVNKLIQNCSFTPVAVPNGEKEVKGGYVGDLLSWVMGRAEENCAWITIMSNINIVAVASLADVGCIVLSEGVTADENVIKTANEKGVNIVSTDMPSYEAAVMIGKLI